MKLAWIVTAACVGLAACGGDDDGGGGDDGASLLRPYPDEWPDGEKLAAVVLTGPRRDPVTFLEPSCTMTAQAVRAMGATSLGVTDREGACVVTAATSFADVASGLDSSCVGDVALRFGATSRRITLCGDTIAPPLDIGCDLVEAAMTLEASADASGMDPAFTFMTTVERPSAYPVVTTPMWIGEGTAVWPDSGPLLVEWRPENADAMEIVLRPLTGGAAIRCMSLDDGSFTVPERLLTSIRTGTATLELHRIQQNQRDAGEYDVRVSYVISDAIQIFVRR